MNNTTNLKEMERRFRSRYIHTGFDPFSDTEEGRWEHPLQGCTGYFIQCYNCTTAGDDALFVPDMSSEEFMTRMKIDHVVNDESYDLMRIGYHGNSELCKSMVRKYVYDLMPIHTTSLEDSIPCLMVDSFMELEEYQVYQELVGQVEENPLLYIKENKKAAEEMHYDKDGENPSIKFINGIPYGRQSHICTWQWQLDNNPYQKMSVMEDRYSEKN